MVKPQVSHSALIAGDWQSWGTRKYSMTLPVWFLRMRTVENFKRIKLKKLAKGNVIFIDMVYLDGNGDWLALFDFL